MSRTRLLTSVVAFLMTFSWLWLGDPTEASTAAVVWPSFLAIGLAFVTRHIYLSLFLGAWSGAILLHHGNLATSFLALFDKHLLPSLSDSWNLSVLIFTLLMGGFVEVLNANGGMAPLASKIVGKHGTTRRTGLAIWILGWILFFDGLANAMLVGKTMRASAQRAGMSSEKLAFLVDSTSSPIAGLALISTWVAYEMSVIQQGLDNAPPGLAGASYSPFQILVQSLPYRFYNYFILLLVLLVVWRVRDFGPMFRAEQLAKARSLDSTFPAEETSPSFIRNRSIWLALGPILILFGGVFGGLFVQGGGMERALTWDSIIASFGQANAALVFVWATAIASFSALALTSIVDQFTSSRHPSSITVFFEGMQQMFLPALVLVFAWTLNSVLKELNTAPYLVSLLSDNLPAQLLPALVFTLAALISFGTGTSWGTMALVMPLVVPLALGLTEVGTGSQSNPVFMAAVGAVLAGAVFGDHCSPISDTTIVSAFSSGCGVMEHVRTQLPYALTAAALAVFIGYGPAGWNIPAWLSLTLGAVASWALIQYWGKPLRDPGKP